MPIRNLPIRRTLATVAMSAIALWSSGSAADLLRVDNFGSNPGDLQMFKLVPPSLPASAPLVVALHGCTQRAADYDDETGWTALAQRFGFALLLPQQQEQNNSRLCFNWFNGWAFSDLWLWHEWGSDQTRDDGEALSIKQMIDRMRTDHDIDARQIYITGLSAGGAMTAVMLAVYPELFAGGAIIAGVPYKCATNGTESLTQCGVDLTRSGSVPISDLSPSAWRQRVRSASSHAGPWPRVSIWHGTADKTVRPENARELLEQWSAVHGIDQIPEVETIVKGFPHRTYRDTSGRAVIETYTVNGMGHGVPVDPGRATDQCGLPGTHVFAVGICSSFYIGRFWGLISLN